MKRVMILGAGIMQMPALNIAREMGWKTFCVDRDESAPAVDLCDHFLPIDLKDRVGLARAAGAYKEKYGLDGVMTVGTDFTPSVAWVAEKNNLPGIGYQTALDASDKVRMRACFDKAGLSSPPSVEMSPEMGPLLPLETLNFPLVVKPVDNMGARGVRRVDGEAELIEAIQEAMAFSRSKRAIVEEYLDGPEFSLDALVYNGRIEIYGIADRHIFFPPYFIEMGHTMPSRSDKDTLDRVVTLFKQGIKALGINNGAAKGDIKFSRGKPYIGEIAARLSGGYMSGWTYPYSSGRSAVEGALKICVGEDPEFHIKEKELISAERAFISIPGVIREIRNLDVSHDMQMVRDIFLLTEEGETVIFPRNNVEKCGNVITQGKDRDRTSSAAERAARNIDVILEPLNEGTALFLNGQNGFPPDAFLFPSLLLEEMEKEWGRPDFTRIPFSEWEAPVPQKSITGEDPLDWMGRKMSDVMKKIRDEYGLAKGKSSLFSLYFWTAMRRGSIQGVRWFLDRIKDKG